MNTEPMEDPIAAKTHAHSKHYMQAGFSALLCVVAAMAINTFWGFEGVQKLSVGTAISAVRTSGGVERPLKFNLLLERRIDDYGPIDAQLSIHNRSSKALVGHVELHEGGEEVTLEGNDLRLRLDRLDDENGRLYLRGRTSSGEEAFSLSLGAKAGTPLKLGTYLITLAAYKLPDEKPDVLSKIAIFEGENQVFTTWLKSNATVRWQGIKINQAGAGTSPNGSPYVLIEVSKRPGQMFFWIAPLAFFVVLLMKKIRAKAWCTADRNEPATAAGLATYPRYFVVLAILSAFLLLEGGARIIEWARGAWEGETKPYLTLKEPKSLFELVDQNGRRSYRRTLHQPLVLGNQSFLADKPGNGYRVFLIGGSAAAGWPFETGEFNTSRFLARKLEQLYPQRFIEVVNAAGGTYGSHRVKAVFNEIIKYQPDLVIIYSGNNEFLENIVYRRQMPPAPWMHFALARLGYELYSHASTFEPNLNVDGYTLADQRSNRIAFAFGKASFYRRDPQQFEQLIANYRYNIASMVRDSLNHKVDVMLLNVPVNLKDWVPNASRHKKDLTNTELTLWQKSFSAGVLALEDGNGAIATSDLSRAAAIDDEHAETHYFLGRAFLLSGNKEKARREFVTALESDAYPFRAIPQLQQTLVEVSAKYNVPLVDIITALERNSRDGIIGQDVLIDYVHPSEQSQEIIAQEILRTLTAGNRQLPPPARDVEAVRMQVPNTFRPREEAYAIEAIYSQYLIMRQYDKMDDIHRRYVDTMHRAMAEEPTLTSYCQRGIDIVEALQPIVQSYAKLLRAEKLGRLEQEYSLSEAHAIYQRYIDMIKALEAPEMSREAFLLQVPKLGYPEKDIPRQ